MAVGFGTKCGICLYGPKHGQEVHTDEKGKSYLDNKRVFPGGASVIRHILITAIALAVLTALVGGLSYFGVMNIGFNSVGTLGQNPAFWLLIGGGAVALAGLASAISQCGVTRSRQKAPKDDLLQHD